MNISTRRPPLQSSASALVLAGLLPVAPAHAQAMRHLDPAGLPPAHGDSHVVVAPKGRLVVMSGQVALDGDGRLVSRGDFEAQCMQVHENLKRALAALGLGFKDVIRTDIDVTDFEDLATLREVRARDLPPDAAPASTLIQVDGLFRPDLRVEVSVEAILPDAAP